MSAPVLDRVVSAQHIIQLFNDTFLQRENTRLQGGADEPLYTPAPVLSSDSSDNSVSPAVIYFRFDYVSSALHEISHWTIAGAQRRLLEDYGYWYETDDRSEDLQKQFEAVEVKPQAVEMLLHLAAGIPFRVSVDNLSLHNYDGADFIAAVTRQAHAYCQQGLPVRAMLFVKALLNDRGYRLQNDQAICDWLLKNS